MGMFDNVKVEYTLPDTPRKIQREVFQTKSFGDGFTGGFMDDYTITREGTLIKHKYESEIVPKEERPYYGKPEWDKNPLFQIIGSLRRNPVGEETIEIHDIINIYTIVSDVWYEYEVKFTDGKVSDIKRIYREFGK